MQETPTLADLSPSRSVVSYRSDVGYEDDVAQLRQQLHQCRLALAETSAEKERVKILLENEREEAKLRRNGAAEVAQQQIARAEAKAAAYREQADSAASALASVNAKLQEAESWRDNAKAQERKFAIAEHAQQVSEAHHSRALSELEALQAQADSATQAHEKMAREHGDELRAERRQREHADQQRLELERFCDGAERNAASLQERLVQSQTEHAEALEDILSLRASLEAGAKDLRKYQADAHAWEERAHAAIAEAKGRGRQGTAAGSATVALLTSDIAATKQLLHAERATKAKFASELASERNQLEAALAQAKREREVALEEVSAAREEAEISAKLAAEHMQRGRAAQQNSEIRMDALKSELAETRAEAKRHAAAVSSVKTAAGAAEARVEADSADLRRCLRVAEGTAKVHATEASALEICNGQLQHKFALLDAKYQAAEDQISRLSRENSKLQEDMQRLVTEERSREFERSAVDSTMRKDLAKHEATILRLNGELGLREATIAAAAEERVKHGRALVDAENRLAQQEQARIQSEARALAALKQAGVSAHETATTTAVELSERVICLHNQLRLMHDATAAAAAERTKARAEETELAAQWQLRVAEAAATEKHLKAQLAQLARETTATKQAGEIAENTVNLWKRRAEAAIEEAGNAHSELAEFGAELQTLHSLHRQSVSEHRAEGKWLRSEVSIHGAEAERNARTVAQLASELRHSEEKHQLAAARAEQSAQVAFALEMRAAQAEAEELVRRTQATADARHRAEELSGILSARRSSLSPPPAQNAGEPSRYRSEAAALQTRQLRGACHDVSSAAAVVSGTIGQHLRRHSNRRVDEPRTPTAAKIGVDLRGPAANSHRHTDSLASLLESPNSSPFSSSYSPGGTSRSASEDDHETTFGVLSMLEGLQI